MGKSLIIPNADFSQNCLYTEKDINLYLKANSSAIVTLNIPGQKYNPNEPPVPDNRTVVTLTNNQDIDAWIGMNPSDYVADFYGAAGIFSGQPGYDIDNTSILKIKLNIALPGGSADHIFAPIYTTNNIKEVYWGPGDIPYNAIGAFEYFDISKTTYPINTRIIAGGSVNVINISNCTFNWNQISAIICPAPNKFIVNNVSQTDITNLLSLYDETYTQTTDSEGNTVLLKNQ